jgi:dTDP-4-amino-4,6-dideoxygalactose transaminase
MKRDIKLFPRVRPYINAKSLYYHIDQKNDVEFVAKMAAKFSTNNFFFTNGRSSLKWILAKLRKLKKKKLRIGLQAFTCHIVVQAILESLNTPVFLDIDSNSFTTPLKYINFEQIDVLILTHLFGIPNPEYFEICERCHSKNIYLIDDLALTFQSSSKGSEVGKAGDAAFFSFGFDKPISCYQGGLLRVNNTKLADKIVDDYYTLPKESTIEQISDLKKLQLSYDLYNEFKYRPGYPYMLGDSLLPILTKVNNKYMLSMSFSVHKLFKELYFRLFKQNSSIKVKRMGPIKCSYLDTVVKLYPQIRKMRLIAAEMAREKILSVFSDIILPILSKDDEPSWHRLPLLAPESKRKKIIQWANQNQVEIGSLNWNYLCFEPFKIYSKINPINYPQANAVKNQILNLPIWSEAIWSF